MTLIIDLLLAAAFLLTLIAGVRNGFFRELFALGGAIGGFIAGIRLTGPLTQRLPEIFRGSAATAAILFFLIFVAFVVLASLLGGLLGTAWEGKKPGSASRVLGLVLGGVRGVVLVLFLAGALVLLAPAPSEGLARSRVLPFLSPGVVWGAELLPRDLKGELLRRWGLIPFPQGRAERRDTVAGSRAPRGRPAAEEVPCRSAS